MKTNRVGTRAFWTLASAGLLVAAPADGSSQARIGISVDWWDRIGNVRVQGSVDYGATHPRPVYRDHGYVRPPRPVNVRRSRHRVKRGPPFCRSGAGHPVHGWRWCVEKGFARARRPRPDRHRLLRCCTWHPIDLGRVRFRSRPSLGGHRHLRHERVVEVLGPRVVDRLYIRTSYPRGVRLEGRWYPAPGEARVLQLRVGSNPLAELTDVDGDRRVDRVMLARTGRFQR